MLECIREFLEALNAQKLHELHQFMLLIMSYYYYLNQFRIKSGREDKPQVVPACTKIHLKPV